MRDEGRLDTRSMRAGIFRIGGVSSASTEAASVIPAVVRPDTREVHIERQRRQFVMDVFAERLRSDTAGVGTEAVYDEILGNGVATASMSVPAEKWSEGVLALDQMVRLTLERGLDKEDIESLRRRCEENPYDSEAPLRLTDLYSRELEFELALDLLDRLVRYLRPDELHTAFNFAFLLAGWDATELRTAIADASASPVSCGADTENAMT